MPRRTSGAFQDRLQTLLTNRRQIQTELAKAVREVEFLTRQVREATAQLRHYETLLATLRKDWGETPALQRILRRLD